MDHAHQLASHVVLLARSSAGLELPRGSDREYVAEQPFLTKPIGFSMDTS